MDQRYDNDSKMEKACKLAEKHKEKTLIVQSIRPQIKNHSINLILNNYIIYAIVKTTFLSQ